MGLAKKSAIATAFIGSATAAQAALSLLTVDFVVTDNDNLTEISIGSTGSISFVVDDSTGSIFDNPFYEFDGAIQEVANSNIGALTFSAPGALNSDIATLDNFNVNGSNVDATNLDVSSTIFTSDPNLVIDDIIVSLAADETLWSVPDTISGSIGQNFDDLVSSGSPLSRVLLDFNRSGSSNVFDVKASVTGGSLSAIPEPSAYGAIAGTLALAGAAATRRRREKNDLSPSLTND